MLKKRPYSGGTEVDKQQMKVGEIVYVLIEVIVVVESS